MWTEWQVPGDPDILHGIGRMPLLTPSSGDVYFLRCLLKHRRGAISFEDLRTVNGTLHPTYQSACVALHYIEDDFLWIETMKEACETKMPRALRDLFGSIVFHCHPSDKPTLFQQFQDSMLDDFRHTHMKQGASVEAALTIARNELLTYLNNFFHQFNETNASYDLPMPDENLSQLDMQNELDPNAAEYYANNIRLVQSNLEQMTFFQEIQRCIDDDDGGFFGLDAPAGTGKTFLINLILAYVRKDNNIAIACAMSGIASLILRLGTTYHKRWCPPKHPKDEDTCNIALDSEEAAIIRAAKFIAIDETSMMHKEYLDCMDTFCRQLMTSDKPFGGKLVVIIFDLRQLPPVVVQGKRASIASKSIKNSRVWKYIQLRHLARNMRVERLIDNTTDFERIMQLRWFANWLLQIGNGLILSDRVGTRNLIEMPQYIQNFEIQYFPIFVRDIPTWNGLAHVSVWHVGMISSNNGTMK